MFKVGDTPTVVISRERVIVLEEVKFITRSKYVPGPEGTTGYQATVKEPVEVPTFRCRRFVPAAGNSQSRYETFDFTEGELEIVK